MRRLMPIFALLALSACGPKTEDVPPPVAVTPATPAPAPPPHPFAGDFNALGTEPFWAVEVRATNLKLTRPDAGDLTVPNPGPKVEGAKAVWPAQGLVLTLTQGECSDGMSDRTYPYFAEVTTGTETLKGCAVSPAALAAMPAP